MYFYSHIWIPDITRATRDNQCVSAKVNKVISNSLRFSFSLSVFHQLNMWIKSFHPRLSLIEVEAQGEQRWWLHLFSEEATILIFNWLSRIIPWKRGLCFIMDAKKKKDHCRLSCVNPVLFSLPLSSPCKNEQLYIATGQVLRDRRSTEPVSGGEWASSRRRDGGCCKIWNRRCTNHTGAVAFQFGRISRSFFLNITKTNYPGPWCMFLLLWKTIKLYKWFMPFHAAIFSLWISKPPPSMLKAMAFVLRKSPWCFSS